MPNLASSWNPTFLMVVTAWDEVYARKNVSRPSQDRDVQETKTTSLKTKYWQSVFCIDRLLLRQATHSLNAPYIPVYSDALFKELHSPMKSVVNYWETMHFPTRAVRDHIHPPRRMWSGFGVQIRIRTPDRDCGSGWLPKVNEDFLV